MVKEVAHLTMVLVLDEDHTHYSNAFGNLFESGALCKKWFPEGSDGIKTKKGPPEPSCATFVCMPVRMMITPIVTWQLSIITFNGGAEHVMAMLAGIYRR